MGRLNRMEQNETESAKRMDQFTKKENKKARAIGDTITRNRLKDIKR